MKTLSPMKLRIMVQAFKIRIKNGESFEEIAGGRSGSHPGSAERGVSR